MAGTYLTIDGRVLDLGGLSGELEGHLERCLRAWREGMLWAEFVHLSQGMENPLVRVAGRVTPEVWHHPLFQAVRDLEDRVGLAQHMLRPGTKDDPGTDPLADEWIPSMEAIKRKGVSLSGLHKAIDRGTVIARPLKDGGTRLQVSLRSLERWKPNAIRQAAGKKAGQSE